MLGPGYGHNIEPYLDYFNRKSDKYKLTFIYWGKLEFLSKFKNIQFIEFTKLNILKIYKVINESENKLIWQHGNNIIIYTLIKLFKRKKITHFLNIWSDRLYLDIKNSFIKKIISNMVLKNEFIHCYWYTTTDNLKSQIKIAKYNTIDCGMHRDIFIDKYKQDASLSSTFKKLLKSVKKIDQKKFFYPKSMTNASGHFLILEACVKLKNKNFNDFKVIFRRGNEINNEFENKIRKFIIENQLENNVIIQEYSYLSFFELALLWKEMDCGLQIAFHDQLSTTFLEPMLFEKELIATNIKPYIIYKEKFNVELNLCELNSNSIFKAMKNICLNNLSKESVLKYRKKTVENNFDFEKNIGKIIEYYTKFID